jgi:integrase
LYARIENHAIATGKLKPAAAICAALKGALTPVKTTNFAAITEPRKIGELLKAIHGYEGFTSVRYALKLAPYLFVRPGELRGAEWREFDLGSAEPVWRIPGARMKMDELHIVPLAKQPLAILRELQALTGMGCFYFPACARRIGRSATTPSMRPCATWVSIKAR